MCPECVFSVTIMAFSLDLDAISGQWVPAVTTGQGSAQKYRRVVFP